VNVEAGVHRKETFRAAQQQTRADQEHEPSATSATTGRRAFSDARRPRAETCRKPTCRSVRAHATPVFRQRQPITVVIARPNANTVPSTRIAPTAAGWRLSAISARTRLATTCERAAINAGAGFR